METLRFPLLGSSAVYLRLPTAKGPGSERGRSDISCVKVGAGDEISVGEGVLVSVAVGCSRRVGGAGIRVLSDLQPVHKSSMRINNGLKQDDITSIARTILFIIALQ
jgi:hypothetical protein